MNVARLDEETKEKREECKVYTNQLKSKLLLQDFTLPIHEQGAEYRRGKERIIKERVKEQIINLQAPSDRRRREENSLKGSSNWLAAQPTTAQRHYLSKREFEDAIRLRIGMESREMGESRV